MIHIDKHVGDRIRARRQEVGITQELLANKIAVTESQMRRYENGSTAVKPSTLEKLARILKVQPAFFLEGR